MIEIVFVRFLRTKEKGYYGGNMWKKLYDAAVKVQNSRTISPFIDAGGVAAAILTMQGNTELLIENHRGLLQYDTDEIRVRTKTFAVQIEG